MVEDPEIRAMASLAEILSQLDREALERVLRWAAQRFSVSPGSGPKGGRPGSPGAANSDVTDFADFFSRLNLTTENDKVLAAGYWFQQVERQEELDAQQLNSHLRHLGHAISNITRTFGRLMEQRPQLAIQTHKDGTSKQARKRYRITAEGIRAVERMTDTAFPDVSEGG
jgi:hypothetical protein